MYNVHYAQTHGKASQLSTYQAQQRRKIIAHIKWKLAKGERGDQERGRERNTFNDIRKHTHSWNETHIISHSPNDIP